MKKLTKALAVFSMMGSWMAGTQALAEPFKVGVCYDLSKAYTFATPQVSQAAMDVAKLINMQGLPVRAGADRDSQNAVAERGFRTTALPRAAAGQRSIRCMVEDAS